MHVTDAEGALCRDIPRVGRGELLENGERLLPRLECAIQIAGRGHNVRHLFVCDRRVANCIRAFGILLRDFEPDHLGGAVVAFRITEIAFRLVDAAKALVRDPGEAPRREIIRGRSRQCLQHGQGRFVVLPGAGRIADVGQVRIAEHIAHFHVADRERLLRGDIAGV